MTVPIMPYRLQSCTNLPEFCPIIDIQPALSPGWNISLKSKHHKQPKETKSQFVTNIMKYRTNTYIPVHLHVPVYPDFTMNFLIALQSFHTPL